CAVTAELLQTLEGPVQVHAGEYVCRGERGELWAQSEEALHQRYAATGEFDSGGWREYRPLPDSGGVLAIRLDRPFSVVLDRGVLRGKAGDYLLQDFAEGAGEDPRDLWIVDASIFAATYRVDEGERG
ncbi:MAG: PGDYG domain-containing protein, partial [Planctomycetaceae bacterium]